MSASKQVAFVYFLKLLIAAIGFVSTILITRSLTLEDSGDFFFYFALAGFSAAICKLGMSQYLVRLVAKHKHHFGEGVVKPILLRASKVSLVSFTLVSAVLLFWGWQQDVLLSIVILLLLLSFLLTVNDYLASGFKGLTKFSWAVGLESAIRFSLLFTVVMCVVGGITLSVEMLLVGCTIGLALSAAIGGGKVKSLSKNRNFSAADLNLGNFNKPVADFFMLGFLSLVLTESSILFLKWLSDESQVAYMGVCIRISSVLLILLMSVNTVVSPKFAAYKEEDSDQLVEGFQRARVLSTVVVACMAIGILFFAKDILSLFGQDFIQAKAILSVIIVAQVVKVMFGSVGQLLIMRGNENIQKRTLIYSVLTYLCASVALIPEYGALGASFAILISVTINNSLGFIYVNRFYKISLIPSSSHVSKSFRFFK